MMAVTCPGKAAAGADANIGGGRPALRRIRASGAIGHETVGLRLMTDARERNGTCTDLRLPSSREATIVPGHARCGIVKAYSNKKMDREEQVVESMNADTEAGLPMNGSSAPLYQQVAQVIERRIMTGTYPVGGLLPTENELAQALKVSRQTVRLAIAQLRQRGQLSARKGVGTWVEAGRGDWRNRFNAQSRAELFDFARETEMHIAIRSFVAAQGRQAAEIGCRPGKKWDYFAGPRFFAGESRPFCYNEVFLEPRLASVLKDVAILRSALFILVEENAGERIVEIVQEMRAITFEAHKAAAIGIEPGSLGLQISRRYYGSGHRLLEYAIQSHPADSFVYRVTLKASD